MLIKNRHNHNEPAATIPSIPASYELRKRQWLRRRPTNLEPDHDANRVDTIRTSEHERRTRTSGSRPNDDDHPKGRLVLEPGRSPAESPGAQPKRRQHSDRAERQPGFAAYQRRQQQVYHLNHSAALPVHSDRPATRLFQAFQLAE